MLFILFGRLGEIGLIKREIKINKLGFVIINLMGVNQIYIKLTL